MLGAYVAATIVSLVQYCRLREKKLLALAALFALQAQALEREWYDPFKAAFQWAACGAGLLLLFAITWRHPSTPRPSEHPPIGGSSPRDRSGTPGQAQETPTERPS